MQPSWDDLALFLSIARAGQLARAAAQTGRDATTLGRRLRKLEATLGQRLFEQTREGQVLTEAGERLLAHVEVMERAADRIADRADRTAAAPGLSGLLRVSVSEGFGTWFVAHHLHAFAAQHPRLSVDLVASSGFLSPSRRETDLAVMLARPRAGPVVSGKLSDYALKLYASRDYLARAGTPDDAAALARDHALVGYIPDLLYSPELRYLGEIDPALSPTIRSSSINAQYRLIAAGAGVGVLPCFIGDTDADLVRVLPAVTIRRAFWIVTHRDTRQLARVRAFRTWLAETAAGHRGRLMGEGVEP